MSARKLASRADSKNKPLADPEVREGDAVLPAANFTDIRMDWSNTGAVISINNATILIVCPVCSVHVTPGIEHRCGDMLPKPSALTAAVKPKRKRAAKLLSADGGVAAGKGKR